MTANNFLENNEVNLETLSDRLLYVLELCKITQAELARKICVKPQAINYLCKSKTKKSQLTFEIAEALGISGEWLASGIGYIKPEDNPEYKLLNTQYRIPMITHSHIKLYCQNQFSFYEHDFQEWLLTTAHIGKDGFAIKIHDKSMYPRFDTDTIAIINPEKKPNNKEFVLAYIRAIDDVVLRQIEFDNNTTFLNSINTAMYKQLTINKDDQIIGTLVEARWLT